MGKKKNRRPATDTQKEWRATRIKGKKKYIIDEVVRNGIVGFIVLLLFDMQNFKYYSSITIDGFNVFKKVIALLVLVFVGTWFHAQSYWRKNEKQYLESIGEIYKDNKIVELLYKINPKYIDYILKCVFIVWGISLLTYLKAVFPDYYYIGAYSYDIARIIGIVLSVYLAIITESKKWYIVTGIFFVLPAFTNILPF